MSVSLLWFTQDVEFSLSFVILGLVCYATNDFCFRVHIGQAVGVSNSFGWASRHFKFKFGLFIIDVLSALFIDSMAKLLHLNQQPRGKLSYIDLISVEVKKKQQKHLLILYWIAIQTNHSCLLARVWWQSASHFVRHISTARLMACGLGKSQPTQNWNMLSRQKINEKKTFGNKPTRKKTTLF